MVAADAAPAADEMFVPPIEYCLREVAATFELAAAGGPDVLPNAVEGLRALLRAGLTPAAVAPPSKETVDRLAAAIRATAEAAVDACGYQSPVGEIPFGFSVAIAFAGLFKMPPAEAALWIDVERAIDSVDHIALIAAELDAINRRRRIANRGDVLRRAVAVARAAEADGTNRSVH